MTETVFQPLTEIICLLKTIIAVVEIQTLKSNGPDLTPVKITRKVVPEFTESNISLHEQSYVPLNPETGLHHKLFGIPF